MDLMHLPRGGGLGYACTWGIALCTCSFSFPRYHQSSLLCTFYAGSVLLRLTDVRLERLITPLQAIQAIQELVFF